MSSSDKERSLPLVAIVGRPNVGKSSLFNRLTGTRRAIVTDESGITRDRLYGTATWLGKSFEVVDTGGFMPDERATLAQEILRQARVAIDAAVAVVLVVDARAGVTPLDADLARLLARTGKRVVVAANKVDSPRLADTALAFHELGVEPIIPISAEHGLGVADLLDELTKNLSTAETAAPPAALNVAIIGRPNVGKSTLLNRLAGAERAIVAPEPGTTRDAVDTLLRVEGGWWRLIDTAGIRRKGKTKLFAEKLSVIMARKHLERADVAVLLIDATEGVTQQDAAIAGYAHEGGRSLVLAVNKWDAVPKKSADVAAWTRAIRQRLKFLDYAPLVFISALTGQRLGKLAALIAEVGAARQVRISDEDLKEFLRALPLDRATVPGGRPQLFSLKQVAAAPPTFALASNLTKLHFAFERFLENQLRERFPFPGTPLRLRLEPRRGRPRRLDRARRRH
ncbi:MAG: ribosome biogenesis GTPase Der [Acidobacteria bacterium RIFCSPHIGHO2_12_FULL_67_30]|nr:MAG: ribosome biogenesis GTPase Der [Acidobacteria bacterium RIFCSPHIGHO2_12_FULL_67_30]